MPSYDQNVDCRTDTAWKKADSGPLLHRKIQGQTIRYVPSFHKWYRFTAPVGIGLAAMVGLATRSELMVMAAILAVGAIACGVLSILSAGNMVFNGCLLIDAAGRFLAKEGLLKREVYTLDDVGVEVVPGGTIDIPGPVTRQSIWQLQIVHRDHRSVLYAGANRTTLERIARDITAAVDEPATALE